MKSANNIHVSGSSLLRVAVLVLDEANMLSLAAAIDPMRAANRLAPRRLFDWTYVTAAGHPARLTGGISVPGDPIARLGACDLLLVVAGFNLAAQTTPALQASLRRIAATGATLGGIDGGPWILASAGLLDGYCATTHWEDFESFAARFPGVTVLRDRFHVDGPRMTCGGATPAIDMMLHLIAARGGAALAARPGHSALTARASALMEDTLDSPLPIAEIARRLGTSPRALQAQFRQRLNTTPQAHALSLRLAEALRLVTDTRRSLTDIALATGFASQSSFARAFRAAYGRPARNFRRPLASSL